MKRIELYKKLLQDILILENRVSFLEQQITLNRSGFEEKFYRLEHQMREEKNLLEYQINNLIIKNKKGI